MKLNNKGFAITTILYGTLILFLLLFASLLGILSQYRKNLDKLIEGSNGTRDIVTMIPKEVAINTPIVERGIYEIKDGTITICTKYLKENDSAICN